MAEIDLIFNSPLTTESYGVTFKTQYNVGDMHMHAASRAASDYLTADTSVVPQISMATLVLRQQQQQQQQRWTALSDARADDRVTVNHVEVGIREKRTNALSLLAAPPPPRCHMPHPPLSVSTGRRIAEARLRSRALRGDGD